MWEGFWVCLDYFLHPASVFDFEARLKEYNHTSILTLIGDHFLVGSTGGTVRNMPFPR